MNPENVEYLTTTQVEQSYDKMPGTYAAGCKAVLKRYKKMYPQVENNFDTTNIRDRANERKHHSMIRRIGHNRGESE